ncbi:type II toxin-antitoxin system RelE/ParE family toxin [Nemorincola caseinilytica]|uniref:type II toxin-antitoxin system RelE/ParE family toxin n=1 Tax=Nemorincola caseinilytica TaxID=2054315 RepID=UPI0031EF656D
MSLPYTYELSQEADNDLQDIYDHTHEHFGAQQAIDYLTGIEDLFHILCAHPHSGRARNEIRKGLRSISYVAHVVFYRIIEKRIRIVRVLHASRDLPRYL